MSRLEGMRRFGATTGVLVLLIASAAARSQAAGERAWDAAERVGSETCEFCHEEQTRAFRPSVHWRTDPEGSCESCHGPGSAHVEETDPSKIRRFVADAPAADLNAACLSCHGRDESHRDFEGSEHGLAAVTCVTCHSPHGSSRRALLKESTPALCYDCHADVRARFALNERHRVDRGSVECQDCHDPHARTDRSVLGGFKQETCLGCHSEYRGPWFFEHEAVTVEGCTTCHSPHGSVNRHLLDYQRVSDLCLQCHPGQPFFHDVTDAGGARTTKFNDCTRCHTEIHGSNNDALFLN